MTVFTYATEKPNNVAFCYDPMVDGRFGAGCGNCDNFALTDFPDAKKAGYQLVITENTTRGPGGGKRYPVYLQDAKKLRAAWNAL